MKIYMRRSDGAYCEFSGMSLDMAVASLAAMSMTGTLITKEEYDAATQSNVLP